MRGIFLLLGSNLGDRLSNFRFAVDELEKIGVGVQMKSKIYETGAWGISDQPNFLNQVLQISTEMNAHELLHACKSIEKAAGREQNQRWGPRVLDIDILYYNDEIITSENLIVPHPGIPVRAFTLVPLVEIAPDFVHPILQISNKQMLINTKDDLTVTIFDHQNE